jgi:hypothetical protein
MTMRGPDTLTEFLLFDPVGTIYLFCILILLFVIGIRFLIDYPTMAIRATEICIGGAC